MKESHARPLAERRPACSGGAAAAALKEEEESGRQINEHPAAAAGPLPRRPMSRISRHPHQPQRRHRHTPRAAAAPHHHHRCGGKRRFALLIDVMADAARASG